MKKILLTVAIVFCIFQIVIAYSAIDIGSPAVNRGLIFNSGYTDVNKSNPANANGKITSVEIWANESLTGAEVATFYVVSGNYLSTRDSEYIGNVTAGSKQTFEVNLDVHAGDYLGIYWTGGKMEVDSSGEGIWDIIGDQIPCTNYEFDLMTNYQMSLYGTGITVPNQVTGVSATNGTHTDKVVVTWDVAEGATKYYVWQGSSWIDVGLVTTWDHTGAPAPTITAGTAFASDGASADYVTLSIAGESANVGSSISYKVKAWNAAGYGAESASNDGYRGVGALTYQWQRSAGDSDADYSNIDGATTDPYNDTGAPENGDGRYYKCIENATGAAQQTTNADRGYRITAEGITWNGITITKWNGITITKINGK